MLYPTIKIYNNIIQDTSNTGLIGTLEGVTSYRQSVRSDGGYYICQILIEDRPRQELLNLFYSSLGYDIKATVGNSIAWEGMIYDVTLSSHGVARTRSFEHMSNHVKVSYNDTNNNNQTSAAAQQVQSISTYGRKEEIVLMDSFDQTPAEQRRDLYLKTNAWPWTRTIGSDFSTFDSLEIMACGYYWTMNWRYTTTADESASNVSTWITDIVDTDNEYVTKAKVETNTLAVKQTVSSPTRSWDMISALTEIGDASGDFYRAYVDDGRRFYYRKINKTPNYFYKDGELYLSSGSRQRSEPWALRPAVIRDMDYISLSAEPGSYFDDARDFYVDEIEVSTGGLVALKTIDFNESELLAAQQEMLNRRRGSGGSRSERERLNWKRKVGLSQEDWKRWEKMSPAERAKFRKDKLAEWKKNKKKKG